MSSEEVEVNSQHNDIKTLETGTGSIALPKTAEGASNETPYSVFTPFEKWLIVSMASIASVFR